MWKFGLLALAIGVATLVATIAIGRPLVDPDDSAETAAVTAPARSWGERASDRCSAALAAAQRLSAQARQVTDTDALVRIFDAATEIDGRLITFLRSLTPPPDERQRVDEVLDLLEQQHRRELRTGEKLALRYDQVLLQRELQAFERIAARMRTRFAALGAPGCVAYLDPASYG